MKKMQGLIVLFAILTLCVGCTNNSVLSAESDKDIETETEVAYDNENNSVEEDIVDKEDNSRGAAEETESVNLSKEAILDLASKHDSLTLDDIEEYVGPVEFESNGLIYNQYEFDYDGVQMVLRVIASNNKVISKPYDNELDAIVLFRDDFFSLDTTEKELDYDGTCGDIRHGNVEHIVSGYIPMDDYLTVDLPEGYSLSEYKYWIGSYGGAYFEKSDSDAVHDFENSGFLAEVKSYGGVDIVETGSLVNYGSFIEDYGTMEYGDISVHSGLYETDSAGSAWYMAYTEKENAQISFCIYMNPDVFSKEDFIHVIESIKLDEYAIY